MNNNISQITRNKIQQHQNNNNMVYNMNNNNNMRMGMNNKVTNSDNDSSDIEIVKVVNTNNNMINTNNNISNANNTNNINQSTNISSASELQHNQIQSRYQRNRAFAQSTSTATTSRLQELIKQKNNQRLMQQNNHQSM